MHSSTTTRHQLMAIVTAELSHIHTLLLLRSCQADISPFQITALVTIHFSELKVGLFLNWQRTAPLCTKTICNFKSLGEKDQPALLLYSTLFKDAILHYFNYYNNTMIAQEKLGTLLNIYMQTSKQDSMAGLVVRYLFILWFLKVTMT